MRKFLVANMTKGEEPETPQTVARAAFVHAFGPRTAAWLVGGPTPRETPQRQDRQRHVRRELWSKGVIDFHMPAKLSKKQAEELRWFFVAIEHLRQRPKWAVDVLTHRGRRRFRVRWLGSSMPIKVDDPS